MRLLLLAALIGCNRRQPLSIDELDQNAIYAYHGLGTAASWIYRDDDSEEAPEEGTLLHAQEDDGTVSLRRGARWADGEPTGHLEWDTRDGLSLISWQLPSGAAGSGDLHLTATLLTQPEDCALTLPEDGFSTYHGTYEAVLVYDCDDVLPGRYVFAEGVGLVWIETDTDTLDLVAPW